MLKQYETSPARHKQRQGRVNDKDKKQRQGRKKSKGVVKMEEFSKSHKHWEEISKHKQINKQLEYEYRHWRVYMVIILRLIWQYTKNGQTIIYTFDIRITQ